MSLQSLNRLMKIDIALGIPAIAMMIVGVACVVALQDYRLPALAAVTLGGLLISVDLYLHLTRRTASPRADALLRAEAGLRAIVQSMVAIALDDGDVGEPKARTISRIYTEITGATLDAATIIRIADTMKKNNVAISAVLKRVQRRIDPGVKPLVIMAAYRVATADRSISEGQLRMLDDIVAAIRISRPDLERTMAELWA